MKGRTLVRESTLLAACTVSVSFPCRASGREPIRRLSAFQRPIAVGRLRGYSASRCSRAAKASVSGPRHNANPLALSLHRPRRDSASLSPEIFRGRRRAHRGNREQAHGSQRQGAGTHATLGRRLCAYHSTECRGRGGPRKAGASREIGPAQ
jgi:hypothetical protein